VSLISARKDAWVLCIPPREDWMIYRGLGFLTVLWFGSTPAPPPLSQQQIPSLSQSSCVSPVHLTDGRGGGGEEAGVEPSHTTGRMKTWASINRSILSDSHHSEIIHWGIIRILSGIPFTWCSIDSLISLDHTLLTQDSSLHWWMGERVGVVGVGCWQSFATLADNKQRQPSLFIVC
jgi:hypothetical protein